MRCLAEDTSGFEGAIEEGELVRREATPQIRGGVCKVAVSSPSFESVRHDAVDEDTIEMHDVDDGVQTYVNRHVGRGHE